MLRPMLPVAVFFLGWAIFGVPTAYGQAPAATVLSPLTESVPGTPALAPLPPPGVVAAGSPWEVDAIFGLPTGIRLSRHFDLLGEHGPDAEMFAGAYFLDPALGAGLRWRLLPYQTPTNAFVVRPGVDGYALINPNAFRDDWCHHRQAVIGLAAADVDCAWEHQLDPNCALELGFKLGGGVAFTRHPGLVPLAGVFVGLRY